MALIVNMADYDLMLASSVHANQPSNSRIVIVQDYDDLGNPLTCSAKYLDGVWYSYLEGMELTLSEHAIWSETYLSPRPKIETSS